MRIDYRLEVPKQAQIVQPAGNLAYRLHIKDGKIMYQEATIDVTGNWDEVGWGEEVQAFADHDVIDFQVQMLSGGYFLILFTTASGYNKVGIWPGDYPLYGVKDPYRLYWGTDSHILYMNVESTWVPVSVMNTDGTAGTIDYTRKEW